MKSIYIIIALVILTLGIFLYNNTDETPAQIPLNTELPTTSEPSEAEDMEMTAEEHGMMSDDEVTGGTDIGMEMPIPDMPDTPEMLVTEEKVFDISGANFAFSEKEIRVKEGDTVTIHFTSTNGFHDWAIDEFNAFTERVQTGDSTSVTFVADKEGTFEYYCSVGSHRANGMVGKLIVE